MHSVVARPYIQTLPMPERSRVRPRFLLPEPLQDSFNIIVSGCVSLLILCVFAAFYDKPLHWCIVPIVACGCLSGIDMTAYLRGKLDAFDPLGVVGLFSYHFFFLAPLLTLLSGYHSKFLPAVPD